MLRKIKILDVSNVDMRDYPDFCDAVLEEACWADTGEPLTEEELDTVQDEWPELINEWIHYTQPWI